MCHCVLSVVAHLIVDKRLNRTQSAASIAAILPILYLACLLGRRIRDTVAGMNLTTLEQAEEAIQSEFAIDNPEILP